MGAENSFYFKKEPGGWTGRTTCYDCFLALGGCTQLRLLLLILCLVSPLYKEYKVKKSCFISVLRLMLLL